MIPQQSSDSPGCNLIINADDFGVTEGVNRSICELVDAGALTSATLMATGPAFSDAVGIARSHPRLGIGCHVVLIDGAPLLSATNIASLTPASGVFRTSLPQFALAALAGSLREEEIEAEAGAQIRRIQDTGIPVDHVDTHKHTHMFPSVARGVMRAAVACGVPAVRNPFEPGWSSSLSPLAPTRRLQVRMLRAFQGTFLKHVQEFGLKTTSGAIGVAATGTLDAECLGSLLTHAQPGNWELVCHPGYHDAELDEVKTRLRASRLVEHHALLKQVPEAHATGRMHLMRFSDLR